MTLPLNSNWNSGDIAGVPFFMEKKIIKMYNRLMKKVSCG